MSDVRWGQDVPADLRQAVVDAGLDSVDGAFDAALEDRLDKPGLGTRERGFVTLRLPDASERRLLLKRFGQEKPAERARRLRTQDASLGPAGNEFRNIETVRTANVPTMLPVIVGEEFSDGRHVRGYLLVTVVPGAMMECVLDRWLVENAGNPERLSELDEKLVDIVRKFHRAGLAHQDLYSCHFILNDSGDELEINLIDFGRLRQPAAGPSRWYARLKDLAQLRYSMPPRWIRRSWGTFLRSYLGCCGGIRSLWWRPAIWLKMRAIRRHAARRRARMESQSGKGTSG
ncbi:MAG: lipopolysaccharide kinase InaA family protein [Phycisphaerae bacterium]